MIDRATSAPNSLASLRRIAKTFPGRAPIDAVRDVDIEIHQGDFAAIVGPSGSGKSTLLNILGLLDTPTSGSYVLGGRETERLTPSERAIYRGRMIGFVFQAFHLMPYRTVLDNVSLAGLYTGVPKKERRDHAATALETVGLGHRLDFLPRNISGGERQRVAIARAIAARPPILLCDEPTGNLDSERTETVMELFESLNRAGLTIVMVTHDLTLADRATRVFSVRDGRVNTKVRARPGGVS